VEKRNLFSLTLLGLDFLQRSAKIKSSRGSKDVLETLKKKFKK